MTIFRHVLAGVFFLSLSTFSHAGLVDDCLDKKTEESITACTKIINSGRLRGKDKALSLVYQNRGIAKVLLGRSGEALSDLNKAISLNRDLANLYAARGLAHNNLKHYDLALADMNVAISRGYKNAIAFAVRGGLLFAEKRWDEAMADYNAALKLKPGYARAFAGRGHIYLSRGQYTLARQNLQKALRLDPANSPAKLGMKILKEKTSRAEKVYKKTQPGMSILIERFLKSANKYRDKKEYKVAIKTYDAVLKIDPENGEGFFGRGVSRYYNNQPSGAKSDLLKARQYLQDPGKVAVWLAEIYLDAERYGAAIAEYKKAIKFDPQDSIALNNLAWSYYKLGQAAQGLPYAQRAVELEPRDAPTIATRGNLYEALGRFREALADYRRALQIDPKQKDSLQGLQRLAGRGDGNGDRRAEQPRAVPLGSSDRDEAQSIWE
jgi:tetratricopeptide (TPR) repeat protein